MTAKQTPGLLAPDGSTYVTLTDGAGTLSPATGGGGGGAGDASAANQALQITQETAINTKLAVSAAGLGKAEDSAHVTGDTGIANWGVGNVAQTAFATDGDYIPHSVDLSGNAMSVGNIASGATDSGSPVKIGGKYNSSIQAFTNGQRADLQVDQRGGLLLQDGQTIASSSLTAAGSLFTIADCSGYSSVSVQITSAGTTCTITYEASEDGATWFSVLGYTPAATGAAVPVSTSTTAILILFPLNSKQFRARVSTYTSGTVTIQGTVRKDALPRSSVLAFPTGNYTVIGSSSDAAAVGAAVPTIFEGRTTNKTAVTTGQYVRPIATSVGAAINKPYQVPELDWSYPAASGGISNTTTAVTIAAAAGGTLRNYITSIQLSAPTLGAATEVAIRDGAAGTVIWRGFMSTAGGNQSIVLNSPVKSTANTLLEVVTLTATVTGAVYFNAQGYIAP